MLRAFCFASGHIEFGSRLPDGALPIAQGPAKVLRDYVEVHARHGYKTELVKGRLTKIPGSDMLLVPGVPEAPDQFTALDKLRDWAKWIAKSAPKGISVQIGAN